MRLSAKFDFPLDTVLIRARAKFKVDSSILLRKIALDLYAEIIRRTPVDTGRARANWNLSINSPNTSLSNSLVPSTINLTAKSLSNLPNVYIANGLPYVRELEFGRSDQAPNGFIRLSIQKIKNQRI